MSAIDLMCDKLRTIVGESYVLSADSDLTLYSMDIWARGDKTAVAVAQPKNTEELSQVVSTITAAGFIVIARGAGMSYTKGYTPVEDNSVIIDCLRMNKILEVNSEDMYVTVEAGCSWKKLHEQLKGSGVRTPFWGTLSGLKATVGGGLSQNSIFWGSGQYGSAAVSVTSMDVVVADGTVISTGSAAQKNGTPFFRHFGPDLTGIFCSDNGALGIKATISLRLVPELKARQYASFDFEEHQSLLSAMNEVSRRGLAMECCGFDPCLTEMRAQRDSLINDAKAFAGVLKNSSSVLGAVKDGLKIAASGRRFMKDLKWPCYIIIEERSEASAQEALQEVQAIAKKHGGREVANSIPKILRANPFIPLNHMIGAGGERWIPVHALVPLSKGIEITEMVLAIYEKHEAEIDKHGIKTGFLFNNISTNCLVVEPLFFWPDASDEIQKQSVEPSFYARVPKLAVNLEARQLVGDIRQEITDMFSEAGTVHLQIGKSYHYATGLKPAPLRLVEGIKALLDPDGKMNPGSLGL